MPEWIIEILKMGGVSTITFAIFYIYHQSTSNQINTIIQNVFSILKDMIGQGNLQTGYLQKIDTKIDNNAWCPYIKNVVGARGGSDALNPLAKNESYGVEVPLGYELLPKHYAEQSGAKRHE